MKDTERYGIECTEAGEACSREGRGSYSSMARREPGQRLKNRRDGMSIVLIDESGFMLQPLVRRT